MTLKDKIVKNKYILKKSRIIIDSAWEQVRLNVQIYLKTKDPFPLS